MLPELSPEVSDEGDRRVYRFHWRNADPARVEKARKDAVRLTEAPAPEINLSSFRSWEDLGAWYRGLERDRRVPTPEIRAKAAELTRGLRTDLEKAEAIYGFVAARFRYVSVSLGESAVRPHAASETLANGYGDCKDKHTLYAALLEAAGIEAHAALISLVSEFDLSVPSLQFDHVITAIRLGDEYMWADTTTEVAPFRWLAPSLRGKQALVVPLQGPARLVETPAAAALPSELKVELEGSLDEAGTLTVRQRESYRGDLEVPTRMAFRLLSAEQKKRMLEMALRADRAFSAAPRDVAVEGSDPANVREPFVVQISYSVPGVVDWKDKAPTLRLPEIVKDLPDMTALPLRRGRTYLGGPFRMAYAARIEVPEGWTLALVPTSSPVKEGFGEYAGTYRLEGRRLIVEHTLTARTEMLPEGGEEAYARFRRAVRSARTHAFRFRSTSEAGSSAEAAKAKTEYDGGRAAYKAGDYALAAGMFKRAADLAPNHHDAWHYLGRAFMALNKRDEAIAAFRRQIEVTPSHRHAYNNLGHALRRAGRRAEAEAAFRKQIEIDPESRYAHLKLGELHVEQQRFEPAVAALEKAATLEDGADVQLALGVAYLGLGQEPKAMAALEAAVNTAPTPPTWNSAAWSLAKAGKGLDRAQAWAESAVATVVARLRTVLPEKIGATESRLTVSLSAYWDTLGWIHVQRGAPEAALPYVDAAFAVTPQDKEVAGHRAQLEAKGVRSRLPGGGLSRIEVPRAAVCPAACSASVFVALSSSGKVEAATIAVKGDDPPPRLEALAGLPHGFPFPDAMPARIVLPASLKCPATGACSLGFVNANQPPSRP